MVNSDTPFLGVITITDGKEISRYRQCRFDLAQRQDAASLIRPQADQGKSVPGAFLRHRGLPVSDDGGPSFFREVGRGFLSFWGLRWGGSLLCCPVPPSIQKRRVQGWEGQGKRSTTSDVYRVGQSPEAVEFEFAGPTGILDGVLAADRDDGCKFHGGGE